MHGRGQPVSVDRQGECGRHRVEERLVVVEDRIVDDRANGFVGPFHEGRRRPRSRLGYRQHLSGGVEICPGRRGPVAELHRRVVEGVRDRTLERAPLPFVVEPDDERGHRGLVHPHAQQSHEETDRDRRSCHREDPAQHTRQGRVDGEGEGEDVESEDDEADD